MTEADSIVAAVRSVIGNKPVGLHDPFITDEDRRNVADCLEGDPVGYTWIGQFEADIARYCGRKYAIAVASGTAALHLAIMEVRYRVRRLERVCMPTVTFAGAAAAVRHAGAEVKLVGSRSLDLDLAVDLLGFPSLVPIYSQAIEDSAEALGTKFGQPCGSFGTVSILSFNNNKIVTTGGGGMVLTDDEELAARIRHLATTAKKPSPWFFEHDAVGFNYRMPNICAALGLGQMRRLEETVARKRALHERYRNALPVPMWEEPPGCRANYWLNAITVKDRDATLRALTDAGIACRALFTPLHLQEPYRDCPRDEDLSAAEELFAHTVCLPSGAGVA